MSVQDAIDMESSQRVPRVTEFKRFLRVFFGRRIVLMGSIIFLVILIVAIFAPVIVPYDPNKTDYNQTLAGPSREHLLGTDSLGRDTLSRVFYGAGISLLIGLVSVSIAAAIGITLGMIAGYFGGITNTIIMRFIDALMAFPGILLALVLASILGSGIRNVIVAIGISFVPMFARLMCGQVLACKECDYIVAARSIGSGNLRIMLRHIFPNSAPPLIVAATMMLGVAILAESALSFLGIGITPPTPVWGGMVAGGYKYILTAPLISVVPGLSIMLTVLSLNLIGDGVRDAVDPRLRGTL